MSESPADPTDDQAPTRTKVRGRTTSRIVLPTAIRRKQQSRRIWVLVFSIALVTAVVLLAILLLGPPVPTPVP